MKLYSVVLLFTAHHNFLVMGWNIFFSVSDLLFLYPPSATQLIDYKCSFAC